MDCTSRCPESASDGGFHGRCSPALSCRSPRRYSFGASPSLVPCCRKDRGRSLGVQTTCKYEDSEELSDASSEGSSEDSTESSTRRSKKRSKAGSREWPSSTLTNLPDGHVTHLATPPNPQLVSHLTTNDTLCEDSGASTRRQARSRPPAVPRHRQDNVGEVLSSRHGRLYSPAHLPSRESSLERGFRESSCERSFLRPHHAHARSHHHYHRLHLQHRDPPRRCWCDEEDHEEDSCDERHYSHRHSYHEGLHRAHLPPPPPRSHPLQDYRCPAASLGRTRRSVSPCPYLPLTAGLCPPPDPFLKELPVSSQYYDSKVGRVVPQNLSESDYIALWSCHSPLNVEERLSQLEGDKNSLQLQVSVLSEQVEAQTEKIHELEKALDQKQLLLSKAEEQLQKEVMTRSNLETQRLELLSEISNLKLRQAATERESMDLRDKIRLLEISPDHGRSQNFSPPAASTPVNSFHTTEPPSDCRQTPPPSARRKIDQFGTIPRQQRDQAANHVASNNTAHAIATTGRIHKGVMFGKGFNGPFVAFKGSGKRSTSAPNLAETEKQGIEDSYLAPPDIKTESTKGTATVSPLSAHRSPSVGHKPTGIKKIFTRRLRRSSSGHLENETGDGIDLKRGGVRATANARLGWTAQTGFFKEPPIPFSSWSSRQMEEWFGNLGLSQYSAAVRCWMEAGNHLANATPQQLEKDIGVRHPLHRKKLQLAISNRMSENNTLNKCCAKLDGAWVLRWLDDLGLPQYKDVFSESRVDGLVLNYLTYDDLAFLKISNLLHVTSLKRGIQVLRHHNFDPSVLKRRSVPEEEKQRSNPSEVALWTNHRVMEWLKTVDLSEYAPNLRGSGVHGALMVYEVRFTSEFLASLLSISSSKTLLRRHLSTHFKELVGKEVVQAKRELEVSPGYIPLTTTSKIKMPRKSQFSLKRRKNKSDLEFDDLVCCLDDLPLKLPPLVDSGRENPVDVN